VLRQFERVRALLAPEGLFDPDRKRPLPEWPRRIALLTSMPSSALADMLRTARERWPATALLVVPIPVQGAVEQRIRQAVELLGSRAEGLGLEALVLARGGGSREDLAVFDGEALARSLAACPVPVVCGLGHEDDTTIADLVADYRAATPTAAVVALLPDRQVVLQGLAQVRSHLRQVVSLRLEAARQQLTRQQERLGQLHPRGLLERQREWLRQQRLLLQALSPMHLLERGFCLVRDGEGRIIRSVHGLHTGDAITVQLADGEVLAGVKSVSAAGSATIGAPPPATPSPSQSPASTPARRSRRPAT